MNYTKNYHLPQWVKEDRIMMEDFNRMCADMDAGLTKNARDAASATSAAASAAAAVSSAAMAAAQEAQASADAAMEKAKAAYASDNLPCVMGSFIGTGERHDIEIGFRPKFLLIWGTADGKQSSQTSYTILTTGVNAGNIVITLQTGFQVSQNSGGSGINARGSANYYIAFR